MTGTVRGAFGWQRVGAGAVCVALCVPLLGVGCGHSGDQPAAKVEEVKSEPASAPALPRPDTQEPASTPALPHPDMHFVLETEIFHNTAAGATKVAVHPQLRYTSVYGTAVSHDATTAYFIHADTVWQVDLGTGGVAKPVPLLTLPISQRHRSGTMVGFSPSGSILALHLVRLSGQARDKKLDKHLGTYFIDVKRARYRYLSGPDLFVGWPDKDDETIIVLRPKGKTKVQVRRRKIDKKASATLFAVRRTLQAPLTHVRDNSIAIVESEPDRSRLLYSKIGPADSAKPREILPWQDRHLTFPRLSAGGEHVLVDTSARTGSDHKAFVIHREDGVLKEISGLSGDYRWFDQKHFFHQHNRTLQVIAWKTGDRETIWETGLTMWGYLPPEMHPYEEPRNSKTATREERRNRAAARAARASRSTMMVLGPPSKGGGVLDALGSDSSDTFGGLKRRKKKSTGSSK